MRIMRRERERLKLNCKDKNVIREGKWKGIKWRNIRRKVRTRKKRNYKKYNMNIRWRKKQSLSKKINAAETIKYKEEKRMKATLR